MRIFCKSIVALFLSVLILIFQVPSCFAFEAQSIDSQVQLVENTVQYYDVTTPRGRGQALELIGIGSATGIVYEPETLWLLWLAVWMRNNFVPGNTQVREIEAQRQTAEAINRAGKDNNVDELNITMSRKAGFEFKTNIEGASLESMLGNSSKMTFKVKYKA